MKYIFSKFTEYFGESLEWMPILNTSIRFVGLDMNVILN